MNFASFKTNGTHVELLAGFGSFTTLRDLNLEEGLCTSCSLVCLGVCGCSLSVHSPLTMAVTWSLPVPMRFLTSQTKVVLTASSTFSIFSTLSAICTVSGSSPDMLQEHRDGKHITFILTDGHCKANQHRPIWQSIITHWKEIRWGQEENLLDPVPKSNLSYFLKNIYFHSYVNSW